MQTETILVHLRHIPDYLSAQWSAHMGICIIICAVYLVSLFMAGNPGKLLRKIITTLLVVYILYGIYLRSNKFGYQIILIGLIALFVMGIIRFIINTASEIRQNKIDAKIEEKALAMAEGRRGSFKSNVGGINKYSLEPDPAEANLTKEELQDSIENQIKAAKAQVIRDEAAEKEEVRAVPEKHDAPVTSSWMSASIYADSENSEQPYDSVGTALDYDTIDEDTRNLYRQSMAAFDGNAPSYHIALLDKPTIVWDFHSLLLGIQMMFSFMLTDEKTPLRLCRHCMKVFVASRPSNQFCSPECKNRHNVYKNRAKKKENE